MRFRHVALATAVMALWGFNFVVIDVGLNSFPPLLFAALRFVVAAIPAVFFVGLPCVSWWWIIVIALPLGVGQFGLLFTGMQLGLPAGLASLVLQSQAVFTLLLAAALLHERIRGAQAAGLLLAFAGIAVAGFDLGQTSPLLAFCLGIGAAAMWGVANVAIRKARPPDTFNLIVWISVVPPVPLFALSLLTEGPTANLEAIRDISLGGLGALAYISYLSTVVGFGVWGWLLRRYDAGVVAPYSLLVPIFGLSSAALVLDERFGPMRMIAAALIIGGVALVSTRRRRPTPGRVVTIAPQRVRSPADHREAAPERRRATHRA